MASDGASRQQVMDSIEDPTVRGMVRLAVHVRGYAPYYAVTLILFAFLAFGPRPDGQVTDAAAIDPAGTTAGATQGGTGGARTSSGGLAGGISPSTAGTILAGAGVGGADIAGAGSSAGLGLAGDGAIDTPDLSAPNASDVPTPDIDYGSPLPEPCTVRPPSPAPAVSPSREVAGLQTTAESVAGIDAPVDASPYAEDVASTTGCPDVSDAAPAVPLPVGLPV